MHVKNCTQARHYTRTHALHIGGRKRQSTDSEPTMRLLTENTNVSVLCLLQCTMGTPCLCKFTGGPLTPTNLTQPAQPPLGLASHKRFAHRSQQTRRRAHRVSGTHNAVKQGGTVSQHKPTRVRCRYADRPKSHAQCARRMPRTGNARPPGRNNRPSDGLATSRLVNTRAGRRSRYRAKGDTVRSTPSRPEDPSASARPCCGAPARTSTTTT